MAKEKPWRSYLTDEERKGLEDAQALIAALKNQLAAPKEAVRRFDNTAYQRAVREKQKQQQEQTNAE